ncbi:MAG: hypothetical protein GQ542_13445 [Desulforhopalus sp.]|nr:hypothetical protein [Desulforhopalus sp.]
MSPTRDGIQMGVIIDGDVARRGGVMSCNTWIPITKKRCDSNGSSDNNDDIFALLDQIGTEIESEISATCNGLGCFKSTIGADGNFFEEDPLCVTRMVWYKCTAPF